MNLYTNNPARNAGALTTHDPTTPQSGGGYGGVLKRWNGSNWVNAHPQINTGTWLAKPLFVFGGISWIEVDTS